RGANWYLDANGNRKWDGTVTDLFFGFGAIGDTPLVGDWNGDQIDDVGVHRGFRWYLDANGNHAWNDVAGGDVLAGFGAVGDEPVVGDWNGDGQDDIGVHRGHQWYLDTNGNRSWNAGVDSNFSFGAVGDDA